MLAARRFLEKFPVVAVDVETTGLFPAYGERICEIGIVRAQGKQILDTYQSLINPQRPISPGASQVNGLRDEDVCQAPVFREVIHEVLPRIDGAVLVCHNAPFDLGFLDAEFSRLGLPWQPAGVVDTLEIARHFFNFDSNSLPFVAAYLKVESTQAHRALADAMTTLKVFHQLVEPLLDRGVISGWELIREYCTAKSSLTELSLPLPLQEALEGGKELQIVYVDQKGNETNRIITPLSLLAAQDTVYLVAYCHLRQGERHFRLDRIIDVHQIG